MTPEERDARTVFCMQLAARIRPRDLEEFFSSVGKVCDPKLTLAFSYISTVSGKVNGTCYAVQFCLSAG